MNPHSAQCSTPTECLVSARWDDCADQAVLARTGAPLIRHCGRVSAGYSGRGSGAFRGGTCHARRTMRVRGGRGEVPGDRSAHCGGERARRAGTLGRHRVAARAGPCPGVGCRRSGAVHQRHLCPRHRDGGARRPPTRAPAPAHRSPGARLVAALPLAGRSGPGAGRQRHRRGARRPRASTRSRWWATRSAGCSRCGSRSTGRRGSLGSCSSANLRVRSPARVPICRWACSPRRCSVASRPGWRGCPCPGS